MRSLRLLERISALETTGGRSTNDDGAMLHSVIAHLSRLLNTRQRSALIDLAYGLPDLALSQVGHGSESRPALQLEIRRVIERYEPRITALEVVFVENDADPLTMHFDLGGVPAGPARRRLQVRTTIGVDGRIAVN